LQNQQTPGVGAISRFRDLLAGVEALVLQRAGSATGAAREVRTNPDLTPGLTATYSPPPGLPRAARDYMYGAFTQSGQNLIFCTSQTNAWRLHWFFCLPMPSQPDANA
jgi:hypothetical protein